MTKEEWLKIREQEELPLSVYYEYFTELKPKVKISLPEFEKVFPQFMVRATNSPIYNTSGQPVMYNPSGAMERIYIHYNKKFEV